MTDPAPISQPQTSATTPPERRGLLDIKVAMSTPSPVAGSQFTVYVLVTNLFDVPIWPESPIVFLPSELQVFAPHQIDAQAIQSLDLLIERAAKGEVSPRPELKTKGPNLWQRKLPLVFHYEEPQIKVEDLLKDLAVQAKSLNQKLSGLERQRDEIRARVSSMTQGKTLVEQVATSQTDDAFRTELAQLSEVSQEAEKVRERINALLQQIVILTGSSAINTDGNLLMENFTLPGTLYVRAKGNVLLKNPLKARVAVLDSSLRPGDALQPGNTAVYSLALRTQSRLLFRPSQYSLQHSLNFYFDQRSAVQTNTANQLLTVRAPIWAVMLGSIIGGTAGYLARCFQDACQPGKAVGSLAGFQQPWWYYLLRGFLTAILSAMAIVFLARKSETQSMVSIEDFWGGLVIGFLVGYTGTAAFESIARMNTVSTATPVG